MKTTDKNNLVKIVIVAMLTAVSFVLFLLEFPVIPSVGHLKLDLSDIPALLASILFGPLPAVVIELVKNVIELLVKGMGTQMGFGNMMNFIVGCAFVVPFGLIYKKHKSMKGILLACAVSIVTILIVGLGANYFITPLFFRYFLGIEVGSEALWSAIGAAEIINLIKGIMLSVISFPVAKVIVPTIKRAVKI